jgi:predicted Rossmann-fold nucleotide-binding protein
VPSFIPDVGAWAAVALDVRDEIVRDGGPARSVGVPTWFYGHEPPNVFGDGIAKFFSNALREDGLLARCNAGVVVLPGAAGTVQEIFQATTRLYYGVGVNLAPLVLVGRDHWSSAIPVWPTLEALGAQREMAQVVHLVDSLDEAVQLLTA